MHWLTTTGPEDLASVLDFVERVPRKTDLRESPAIGSAVNRLTSEAFWLALARQIPRSLETLAVAYQLDLNREFWQRYPDEGIVVHFVATLNCSLSKGSGSIADLAT
jgi:hypothetical protein